MFRLTYLRFAGPLIYSTPLSFPIFFSLLNYSFLFPMCIYHSITNLLFRLNTNNFKLIKKVYFDKRTYSSLHQSIVFCHLQIYMAQGRLRNAKVCEYVHEFFKKWIFTIKCIIQFLQYLSALHFKETHRLLIYYAACLSIMTSITKIMTALIYN